MYERISSVADVYLCFEAVLRLAGQLADFAEGTGPTSRMSECAEVKVTACHLIR